MNQDSKGNLYSGTGGGHRYSMSPQGDGDSQQSQASDSSLVTKNPTPDASAVVVPNGAFREIDFKR
jgi:hypothetical protein